MKSTISTNRGWIALGVTFCLLAFLALFIQFILPTISTPISSAITFYILLTIPLIYFLLIRKTAIPKTTVIPVLILGLIIGSVFLPKSEQTYLELFKTWALPILEIGVLIFIVNKVRRGLKLFKQEQRKSADFFSLLKDVSAEILPAKLVMPFATEVAVIYYGIINWKKHVFDQNEFSIHKRSGTPALFGAFIFIILIETTAIHFLLNVWSPIAAWILTGLSLYTALQVLGFSKSLSQRPIIIQNDEILMRYGILNETQFSVSDIDLIELSSKIDKTDKMMRTLSPLGELERPNVVIHLKDEQTMIGLYGFKRKFTKLAFHADQPVDFKTYLDKYLPE